MPYNIIIVEKPGTLKSHAIKEYKEEDLYKKCGFKKSDGFIKHHEWNVKCESERYYISVYGKLDGKANMENKYDFPPPVDTKLFFGNCLLIGFQKDGEGNKNIVSLSIPLWDKIYEKLFGGFEDLTVAALEDEEEEDELDNIPKSKKTKIGGYLKDGFVVDDNDNDNENDIEEDDEDHDNVSDMESSSSLEERQMMEEILNIEDIGSEISEEEYDYSDEENI